CAHASCLLHIIAPAAAHHRQHPDRPRACTAAPAAPSMIPCPLPFPPSPPPSPCPSSSLSPPQTHPALALAPCCRRPQFPIRLPRMHIPSR
ncbi:unnamed protein product, partial [Closterium sp. NIES-54]